MPAKFTKVCLLDLFEVELMAASKEILLLFVSSIPEKFELGVSQLFSVLFEDGEADEERSLSLLLID